MVNMKIVDLKINVDGLRIGGGRNSRGLYKQNRINNQFKLPNNLRSVARGRV